MRYLLIFVVVAAIALIGYSVLTMPDHRTTTDKVSDAVRELPQGPGKAAEQLEDRTPGQKLGDAIKDNTQEK
jgi:hypothetical protein